MTEREREKKAGAAEKVRKAEKMHKYKQIRAEWLCVGMSGRAGEDDERGGERSELYYRAPDHAARAGAG